MPRGSQSSLPHSQGEEGKSGSRKTKVLTSDPTQEPMKGPPVQPGRSHQQQPPTTIPGNLDIVGTPPPGGSGNPHSLQALQAGGGHPLSSAPIGHALGGRSGRSQPRQPLRSATAQGTPGREGGVSKGNLGGMWLATGQVFVFPTRQTPQNTARGLELLQT